MAKKFYLPESLIEEIKRIAQSDVNILITGESGSGKDFVAELIHNYSKKRDLTPVFIDISSIPTDLLERELFGSHKGAFTGSDEFYEGKLVQADNNTLILDGVGDIPLLTQGKINGFLDKGEFEPLGSNIKTKVSCRVIAITNKDLPSLVEDGQFRSDLYYRLNVIGLNIPPLRSRVEVILPLAEEILQSIDPIRTFSKEVKTAFLSYEWPGNIRELRNVIERAAVLCSNEEITSEYLLLSSNNNGNISSTTLKDAVNNFKREYILKVLESNEWNVTHSAKVLGIQRTYLSKLIKDLNI